MMKDTETIENETVEEVIQDLEVNLPSIALLPNTSKALREHRKRHNSEFERIVKHDKGLTRYYSDKPAVCVGQWVLSQFKPSEEQWVLFSPLLNNDGAIPNSALWYGLHVNKGLIQREYIESIDTLVNDFAFECAQSNRVYIPSVNDGDLSTPMIIPSLINSESKLGVSAPINLNPTHLNNLPKKHLTQSIKRWHRPAIIGAVCLCLTGIGVWLTILNNEETPLAAPTIDPLLTWVTQLDTTPNSSQVFKQSSELLTKAFLLPDDWSAESLMLSGQELTVNIISTSTAPNISTLTAWQKRIRNGTKITWDKESNQLNSVVNLTQMPIAVLGLYPEKLYSQLRLVGINEIKLTRNPTIGEVESWTLSGMSTNTTLATLSNLAYLTKNKPVFIQDLTITPHEQGVIDLTFNLSLLGVTKP